MWVPSRVQAPFRLYVYLGSTLLTTSSVVVFPSLTLFVLTSTTTRTLQFFSKWLLYRWTRNPLMRSLYYHQQILPLPTLTSVCCCNSSSVTSLLVVNRSSYFFFPEHRLHNSPSVIKPKLLFYSPSSDSYNMWPKSLKKGCHPSIIKSETPGTYQTTKNH